MTLPVLAPVSAASRRRPRRPTASAMDSSAPLLVFVTREEQPSQGDVLEFAQVTELVFRRQPRLTSPPAGVPQTPHGNPHAGPQRCKRANVGEEVAHVQALRLLQQSERFAEARKRLSAWRQRQGR